MNRAYAFSLLIVALVFFLLYTAGSLASAQGELTLEGLAARVDALLGRVSALEKIMLGSGPIELDDGSCVLGTDMRLQDASVIGYKEAYDEWPSIDDTRLKKVVYNPESGITSLIYEEDWDDFYVIEEWLGCDFVGSSDWWMDARQLWWKE